MKRNTPYKSSADQEYDQRRQEALSGEEKRILSILQGKQTARAEGKGQWQLARELQCSHAELRQTLHSLINKGLVTADQEKHYRLTRAGERIK